MIRCKIMDEVEIKITDNSGLAGDALKKAIARGLEAIGLAAESHAKEIYIVRHIFRHKAAAGNDELR